VSKRRDVLALIADWHRAASPMPMVDILRIAADEIARLREEQRSISTLLQKVESLEADNKRLCKERDTLLESEAWGVNCKPTPEANG